MRRAMAGAMLLVALAFLAPAAAGQDKAADDLREKLAKELERMKAEMRAPPTPEQLRLTLRQAGERLAESQQPDGSWEGSDPVGRAALLTLALEVAGNQRACERGRRFVTEHAPEPRVFAAGIVGRVRVPHAEDRQRALLDAYAALLVRSQVASGPRAGSFSWDLTPPANSASAQGLLAGRGPVTYTFFAALGLRDAGNLGVAVAPSAWKAARDYLLAVQHVDGGWADEQSPRDAPSTPVETFEGAAALYVAEDALRSDGAKPEGAELERALACVAKHMTGGYPPRGWYALARLADATKCAEFGGVDWRRLALRDLYPPMENLKIADPVDLAYAVLCFDDRAGEVIFQKLRHAGDWEAHRNDVGGLTRYICHHYGRRVDWRVVTLEADVDMLRRSPILFISGRAALRFTEAEKKRLKGFADGGGAIWAEAVGGSAAFDASFRALLKEWWPGAALEPLPPKHAIYRMPRTAKVKEEILTLARPDDGRVGVLYFAGGGMGERWARVNEDGDAPADAAAHVYAGVNAWYWMTNPNARRSTRGD